MKNEMTVIENKKDIVNMENNKPSQIVKNAMEAAKELQGIVGSRNKKLILQGKQYLFFEDWQTLGRFDRTTAKVIDTKELYHDNKLIGFSAKAVALKDGIEISAAEAECCFDEPNWKNKPRFQLKSMAQTRACAKALRNCLAFIAVLANYEPTPAEEMVGNDDNHSSHSHTPQGNTDFATQPQVNLINKQILGSHLLTDGEIKKISGYLKNGMTKAKASEIISWWLGDKQKNIEGEHSKREAKEKEEKLALARHIAEGKKGKLELREGQTGLLEDEDKELTDEEIAEIENAVDEKEEPGSSPDNAIPFKGKRKTSKKISKASDFISNEELPDDYEGLPE